MFPFLFWSWQLNFNSLLIRRLIVLTTEDLYFNIFHTIRIGRHQHFYISICISTLPTQHTMFISLVHNYLGSQRFVNSIFNTVGTCKRMNIQKVLWAMQIWQILAEYYRVKESYFIHFVTNIIFRHQKMLTYQVKWPLLKYLTFSRNLWEAFCQSINLFTVLCTHPFLWWNSSWMLS